MNFPGLSLLRPEGHRTHPYRYVEWSARTSENLTDDLRALVTAAAAALHDALGKILPIMAPRRHGVVFGEDEAPADEAADEPVRRRDRRHGRASTEGTREGSRGRPDRR